MSDNDYPPGHEPHLPHEAWHVDYNRIRKQYPQHFNEQGVPGPDVEQHLPHEAWHVVKKVALEGSAPPPFQLFSEGE